jgi:hypothetical protein
MSKLDILAKHKDTIDKLGLLDEKLSTLYTKMDKLEDKLYKLCDKREKLSGPLYDDIETLGLEELIELVQKLPKGMLSQQLGIRCLMLNDDVRRAKEKQND